MNYGESGPVVSQIQLLLIALGYGIEHTGTYDDATMAAVTEWQGRIGVPQTGAWDDATSAATSSAVSNGTAGAPVISLPTAPIPSNTDTSTRADQDPVTMATDPNWYRDGFALLTSVLARYGLGSLDQWALDRLEAGISTDQILLEVEETQEFKDRFPAIEERRVRYGSTANYSPLTPEQYVAYEQQARQMMHQAGMPPGFWDEPEDFYELLVQDVAPVELQERINQGYRRVAEADPLVREAFSDFFGIQGDAALAALYLDPERASPQLEQMASQAEVAGAARQQGFTVNLPLAIELQRAGFTAAQAPDLFARAAEGRGLTQERVGEAEDLTEVDIIRGEAGVADRTATERRTRRRKAADTGAGGARETDEGLAFGAANR